MFVRSLGSICANTASEDKNYCFLISSLNLSLLPPLENPFLFLLQLPLLLSPSVLALPGVWVHAGMKISQI